MGYFFFWLIWSSILYFKNTYRVWKLLRYCISSYDLFQLASNIVQFKIECLFKKKKKGQLKKKNI